MVCVIVNLFDEQTSEHSSEMLHVFIQYCYGTSHDMASHVTGRHLCFRHLFQSITDV